MSDWKKEDVTYLKRYAKTRSLSELGDRFGKPTDAVEDKLKELHLASKDGRGYQEPWIDPAVSDFEAGLEAFHGGQIAKARKSFEKVVAEAEQPDLSARARVYLDLCDRQEQSDTADEADPYLQAVVAKNRGDFEEAMDLCTRGGRKGKDERFAYLAAAIHALRGEDEDAVAALQLAIDMEPKNRIHAYHDSDFDGLREHPEVVALYEQTA